MDTAGTLWLTIGWCRSRGATDDSTDGGPGFSRQVSRRVAGRPAHLARTATPVRCHGKDNACTHSPAY